MKRKLSNVMMGVLVAMVFVMAGCGGGGSSTPSTTSVVVQTSNHNISGKIANGTTALAGVTVTLSGKSSSTTSTDINGNYSFSVAENGSYTITPSKTGYTFTSANLPVTLNGADAIGMNFTFTASNTSSYSVSGNITNLGYPFSGVTVTLSGDVPTSTITDNDGNYIFTATQNGSYTIIPSKPGYRFSSAFLPVTVNGANITRQNFVAHFEPTN